MKFKKIFIAAIFQVLLVGQYTYATGGNNGHVHIHGVTGMDEINSRERIVKIFASVMQVSLDSYEEATDDEIRKGRELYELILTNEELALEKLKNGLSNKCGNLSNEIVLIYKELGRVTCGLTKEQEGKLTKFGGLLETARSHIVAASEEKSSFKFMGL